MYNCYSLMNRYDLPNIIKQINEANEVILFVKSNNDIMHIITEKR